MITTKTGALNPDGSDNDLFLNADSCKMYGVIPVSYFVRNMEKETVKLGRVT